ncbi:hypothetical protein B0H14DRAFT_2596008 [Mycena olivaceomarginata]|nr:hypothetical protein B0H14DRAFT_2596008 [Mycena olivaceomarginata]
MDETECGLQRAGELAEVVVVQGRLCALVRHPVEDEGRCTTAKKCNTPRRSVYVTMGLSARIVVEWRGPWTRARGGCGGDEKGERRRRTATYSEWSLVGGVSGYTPMYVIAGDMCRRIASWLPTRGATGALSAVAKVEGGARRRGHQGVGATGASVDEAGVIGDGKRVATRAACEHHRLGGGVGNEDPRVSHGPVAQKAGAHGGIARARGRDSRAAGGDACGVLVSLAWRSRAGMGDKEGGTERLQEPRHCRPSWLMQDNASTTNYRDAHAGGGVEITYTAFNTGDEILSRDEAPVFWHVPGWSRCFVGFLCGSFTVHRRETKQPSSSPVPGILWTDKGSRLSKQKHRVGGARFSAVLLLSSLAGGGGSLEKEAAHTVWRRVYRTARGGAGRSTPGSDARRTAELGSDARKIGEAARDIRGVIWRDKEEASLDLGTARISGTRNNRSSAVGKVARTSFRLQTLLVILTVRDSILYTTRTQRKQQSSGQAKLRTKTKWVEKPKTRRSSSERVMELSADVSA